MPDTTHDRPTRLIGCDPGGESGDVRVVQPDPSGECETSVVAPDGSFVSFEGRDADPLTCAVVDAATESAIRTLSGGPNESTGLGDRSQANRIASLSRIGYRPDQASLVATTLHAITWNGRDH
ncbi:MAG: hypothetical protein ACT4NY_02125 [Pseudonocardiales bacterium]